ncbi:MAG TPA: ATP synthase F1 subunit epsilon [Alphaproteobacteria bacterium]|nr:ATP synthase F1 subunit epsilon [Paracoccaceae bacterium]RCL79342.1 MAG: ATP synthase F1 subunit epsilon [SAR116 cluster bacterium]HBQ23319.1 ATP synthase F1 subunit epsilon [Alphaproteobacteria bacterium]HCJ61252.1 ATP synthase F1 subunit epsilon [Alphaproteobacteria bacterium]HCY48166.1 ATP synthase F1 subunit epsilon [Alphaproteobacteria bacterium]|tara:strand:+ start:487 stop:885 length:399 start_codon:yes stop_codon:yes gene_type:complete
MADKLKYAIVCPTEKVAEGEAHMVTVPGSEGDFGVLAGHAPFLTTIGSGFVAVEDGSSTQWVHVRGGFAEVNHAGLSLVVEGAIRLADADKASVQERINELSESIGALGDDGARKSPLEAERLALEDVLARL